MKENKNRKEMKRKTVMGMLLICLVLGAVSVGCVIGTVSAEDTTNKKILFDESHHQFWCSCIDAGLADFATELRNNGYQVDRVTDGPLTYDKLRDYEVFVLPNGFVGKHSFDEGVKLLTDEEIKAIKKSAPSTNYHSAIFCNSSFELIPNETTIPTKSTCKQTNFLTERFV